MASPDSMDGELPPLYVSSPGCDDMGTVLRDLGLDYTPLKEIDIKAARSGVVMLNCEGGWEHEMQLSDLQGFLNRGGALFASDHASDAVKTVTDATFSIKMLPTTVNADVVDDELSALLGRSTVELTFDMPAWDKPADLPAGSRPLLETEGSFLSSGRSVLAYHVPMDAGDIVYTSFHNHAQASEMEQSLLRLLVMVPIASTTETTIQETYSTIVHGESVDRAEPTSGTEPKAGADAMTVTFIGVGETDGKLRQPVPVDGEVVLGRDDFEGFEPRDSLTYVSGEHLTLRRSGSDQVLVADRDSTNGTALDGADISDGEPRSLEPGDKLSLADGHLNLRVRYVPPM